MFIRSRNAAIRFYSHRKNTSEVFRQHRLATAEIENGLKISVRLSNEKIKSGELVIVTINYRALGHKTSKSAVGAQITGKYVILLPGRPDISRMSNRSILKHPIYFSNGRIKEINT